MTKHVTTAHVHRLVDLFLQAGAAKDLPEALAILIKDEEAAAGTTTSRKCSSCGKSADYKVIPNYCAFCGCKMPTRA